MDGDRELLEYAAKAAGVPREMWDYEYSRSRGHMVTPSMMWAPVTNYGEALRLAAECRMVLDWSDGQFEVRFWLPGEEEEEEHPARTFRTNARSLDTRAIVRAAAEIGKAMR